MNIPKLQFAIFKDGDQAVPVADYLHAHAQGTLTWNPDVSHTAILLDADGKRWIDASYNLGDLDMLAMQFEAAAPRLEMGKAALVRSAIEDEMWVPYLLMEPASAGAACLSWIYLAETEMAFEYPIPPEDARVEALYAFVEANRAQVIQPPAWADHDTYLLERPFPLVTLVESLRREAALARQLYALLDLPFYPRGSYKVDRPGM